MALKAEHEPDTDTTLAIGPRRRPAAGRRNACLVHIYPSCPDIGTRYFLGDTPLRLGRDPDCDIVIQDPSVSRRHASVRPEDDGYYVIDLQSTNGTFVNDTLASPCKLKDGDYLHVGGCIYRFLTGDNIEAEYYEEIHRLMILDALTTIHNRRYLLDFLARERVRAAHYGRPLTLLMFDIDHFKTINDTWGHLAGDHSLRELVACIQGSIRKHDLLARYGGDEFAVVLPECSFEEGVALAERLRAVVHHHRFHFEGNEYQITLSLGVATVLDAAAVTTEELILRA